MKCDNRCGKQAIYRQNKYTVLCINCWWITADNLLKSWHEDKTKPEPWIFNRDKLI
jgi:hypothetical protein